MIEESANALYRAERSCVPIAPLSERDPSLTPAPSYAIQSAWLDLALEGVELWCDGERVGSGTGAAVLGHPAVAAAWLANQLAEFGVSLLKGQAVLPGAMYAAVTVAPGKTYRAAYTNLGEVSVSFE